MRSRRKPTSFERGQILIPALFVLPSLVLFLFLIMETGKLSQQKIRHQFAVDAASFAEMVNYSDFLNRSAYVNGAFPQRIFYEEFGTVNIDRKNNTSPSSLFDIMWHSGDFPSIGPAGAAPDSNPKDIDNPWPIRFDPQSCGAAKNSANPNLSTCGGTGPAGAGGGAGGGVVTPGQGASSSGGGNQLDILTMQNALDYWLSWDDANDIYNLYVQVYTLLASVEDAQFSVWQRISGTTHDFYQKSYYLNSTMDSQALTERVQGKQSFSQVSFNPKAQCVSSIMIYGNKPSANPFQPYQIFAPDHPIQMNSTMSTQPNACSGLFHLETIPSSDTDGLAKGYHIIQPYATHRGSGSPNYFNINFDALMTDPACEGQNAPCVRSTISVGGGNVWPNPTPKFQTRLSP